jgi:outer membrane lipoprotein SlyB
MRNLLLSLLLALPLAAIAAPMTNEDVIKMVKGGLGEATVLQAIEGAEPGFDTTPDGLVKLKQGGVSDTVIQRIIGRKGATPAVAATPAAAPAAAAPPVCRECGTVTGIREVEKPRKVGAGTATGAVIGGVLGYAVGGSHHRGTGAAVGAVGGGVAGNVIENNGADGKTFEIGVLFDDGHSQAIMQNSNPSLKQGSRVKLVNGALAPL